LSHKTQVFMGQVGDYPRTRLTHTLEVASIARTLARALRLNEDLAEALALAHDIGHPPFGHSGEETLDQCVRDEGGFNHNAQALRIFELIERRYPDFPGLNLSAEVLEGQRHRASKSSSAAISASSLLEVQVVDAADSIAYVAHDADDAVVVGLVEVDQLDEVPLWRAVSERVSSRFGNLATWQRRRAIVHELIDVQVSDVLATADRELSTHSIASVADVRRAPLVVRLSAELAEQKAGLEEYLYEHVYRHPTVLTERNAAQQALAELFALYAGAPDQMPVKYQHRAAEDGGRRAAVDYVAGMTDRFALDEHRRLVGR
jgi:dGTPase